MDEIKISIPALTRVEGEGALQLTIKNKKIEQLNLSIYEPPRLFEQTIVGRSFEDLPDLVSRICGICPVAYQMSAVQALESIFATQVDEAIQRMRRLYYCGEWLESHALHIHLLALPDFLGFNSVIEMAKHYPAEVSRGLRIQHFGNQLIALFGGRSVNPIGACVGGFYSAADPSKVKTCLAEIDELIALAGELTLWADALEMPSSHQDFLYASLYNGKEYPMCHGDIRVSDGQQINIEHYADFFQEHQVSYSTALHSHYQGQAYLVGPLARLNLNHEYLPESVQSVLAKTSLRLPSDNMFDSLLARCLEIVFSLVEAKTLLQALDPNLKPSVEVSPNAGVGYGCTEAPRGLLWHRYETDEQGNIKQCTIVPPTSQNQARIEADIKTTLEQTGLAQDADALRLLAEQVIRNYDPCISCATHFLNLDLVHQ